MLFSCLRKQCVNILFSVSHTWVEYDIPIFYFGTFAKLRKSRSRGKLFIHSVYKQNTSLKLSKNVLANRLKTHTFAANSTKHIKIAVMQRQKFNIFDGLNIQSTWCLECDSYMHTSSIVAPCYSDRKTFHIARRGSGLLLT